MINLSMVWEIINLTSPKNKTKSTPWITHPNSPTILCYIPVKLAQALPKWNTLSREMIKFKTCLIKAVSVNFYLSSAFLVLTCFENKTFNLWENEQLSATLMVAYSCTLFPKYCIHSQNVLLEIELLHSPVWS